MTLLVGAWVSLQQGRESQKFISTLKCQVVAEMRESCLPPPSPSSLFAGGRAGLEIVRVGELVLPLAGCCTLKSKPCTLTGQHIRADPDGEGTDG